ncbi:MAG: branched-chain amino acid transport system II carrier protein [Peptococcaceae bacterium]|nr:branched-chain amino acid transport system II carrier protein [Peptococcaceae bacterium]MDH7524949.1 branched-chain amino acid transport system II carrier protein [Peptococcaceae bacterium]
MRKLTLGEVIVIGAALFAGHFGVGNTIFPMKLGHETGTAWLMAAIGYAVVDSLLPMLGYLAVAMTNNNIVNIASRVLNPTFGKVYATILMLIIGPVFILPRVSSATHEMSVLPIFPGVPLVATVAVFFLLNAYVCLNPSKVVDRLGQILSPLLVLSIALVLIKGIFSPISAPVDLGVKSPFGVGFTYGYNTMDAIGAVLFGGWILAEFKRRNVTEKKAQYEGLLKVGVITVVLLAVTQASEIYLGASTGSLMKDATLGSLPVKITTSLYGQVGVVIFALLMALACFTTSAGLTATSGHFFEDLSQGRLKYRSVVIASSLVGFALANFGLDKIVRWTVPWLNLTYPALIVMIVGTVCGLLEKNRASMTWGSAAGLIFGAMEAVGVAGFNVPVFNNILKAMPLASSGFAWLVPTIIAMIIGTLISKYTGTKSAINT